ncbi:MAG: hypothetical protein HY307_00630 [Arcobacter sp.]|nr:hypothetical protein [Arcobacter sp.]
MNDKIINLIGQENYDLHNNLIRELTKDESRFVINKTLNYGTLLSTLKNEGLINLNLDEQTEITILFNITNSHKKGFKIIKDVLSNIGYSYYFTDFIKNTNGALLWQIRFKSDFMLDPHAIHSELNKFSTNILDINKLNKTSWEYTIEVKSGILKDVVNIAPNEKNILAMPLQPYVLSLNNANEMTIASSKSNNWIPKISFYDTDLNALGTN